MKKTTIILALLMIILSCSTENSQKQQTGEEIIFGEVYGQCAGDCRNLYLLTEEGIYEDSNSDSEFGNWEDTTFENQALPLEKFDLAKSLLQIPEKLLEPNGEIGNQTLADFDYFIQVKINGESKIWVFDELKENTDSEIKNYIDKLIDINNQLRNY
jgi:hypothetical protein